MTPATDRTPRPSTQSSDDHPTPGRRPWYRSGIGRTLKLAGLALVLASYGIWIYVYSGQADRPTPDLLDDPTFSEQAEDVCAAALDDLDALPQALDATSGADRGAQVEASTARLETMVADLETMVTGSERDTEILVEWLGDWRVLIGDRYRFARAVAEDPTARYLQTDTGVGERLDRRITRMATTNDMISCSTPQDVG